MAGHLDGWCRKLVIAELSDRLVMRRMVGGCVRGSAHVSRAQCQIRLEIAMERNE